MPTGQPDDEEIFIPQVERIIRSAMEAGEFDDLPGAGEPIPGGGTIDDELWWVRSWLKRNLGRDHDPTKSE